jgi:hypothetical protein
MVIFIAHANGVSQRELGDVFDLPQSRVSAIVRRIANQLDPEYLPNSRTRPSR